MVRVSLRRLIDRHKNFTNRPKGKLLIIGEKPGDKAPLGRLHVPFLSTKNSSGWLNRLLDEAGVPETELVWLNAYSFHDEPLTAKEVHSLHPSMIITLGGKAHQLLNSLHIEHVSFNHPQYWKRFRSSLEYPLIPFLRNFFYHECRSVHSTRS